MRYRAPRMDTRWSGEAKYQTLLAVSQAANARRELSSGLEAGMEALDGLVPVDLAGVVTRGAGGLRALAAHFRSVPRRPGESHGAYVGRIAEGPGVREEVEEDSFVRDVVERDRKTLVVDHVTSDVRLEGT